ncbi:hypothetical protein LXL04_000226 [Taraxacum kok-saghyz]
MCRFAGSSFLWVLSFRCTWFYTYSFGFGLGISVDCLHRTPTKTLTFPPIRPPIPLFLQLGIPYSVTPLNSSRYKIRVTFLGLSLVGYLRSPPLYWHVVEGLVVVRRFELGSENEVGEMKIQRERDNLIKRLLEPALLASSTAKLAFRKASIHHHHHHLLLKLHIRGNDDRLFDPSSKVGKYKSRLSATWRGKIRGRNDIKATTFTSSIGFTAND